MRKLAFLLSLALVGVLAGCSHKQEPKAELEKAAEALAKTETSQAAPAPAPEPTAAQPAEAAAPAATPAQQVRQALSSYQAGQLEDAVTRLQKLRATPVLSPQQRMALQDSIAAVMNEVYERAAKGDPRAIQAVAQYEQMQNRRP